MESGVSNIAISNEPEKIAETVVEPVVLENATEMVNWYEIIKMILLAAIFIVVVPKPVLKKEK